MGLLDDILANDRREERANATKAKAATELAIRETDEKIKSLDNKKNRPAKLHSCGCSLYWLSIYGEWKCLGCDPYPSLRFVKQKFDVDSLNDGREDDSQMEGSVEFAKFEYRVRDREFVLFTKFPDRWQTRGGWLSGMNSFWEKSP